jgi:hypothetical protein
MPNFPSIEFGKLEHFGEYLGDYLGEFEKSAPLHGWQ